MVDFLKYIVTRWVFHLKNSYGFFKSTEKAKWLSDNIVSVYVLFMTVFAISLIYMTYGQSAKDYTIPRYKAPSYCGENSKLPCK